MFSWRNKNPLSNRRRHFFDELNKRKRELPKTILKQKHRPSISLSRLFVRWQKGFVVAGILALGAFLIYFAFFSESLRVKKIAYAGGDQSHNAALDAFFQPYFNKHFFLLPIPEMEKEIQNKFSNEIQTLNIRRKLSGTLGVRYKLFPPALNMVVKKENMKRKFLINARGLVVGEDAEDPSLPYLSGDFGDFPKLRSMPLDSSLVGKIVNAYTLFTEKFGIKVPEIIYRKKEREIYLRTEKGFFLWMDLTQNVERQLFKLKRALHKLDIYNQKLQYIDLRISGQSGDKVIYR